MLFLLFQLGSDWYALPARDVIEVLPLVACKELPGAPRGVVGLMNYRGAPVPVIDLAALALGRAAQRRISTRLLVVSGESAGAAGPLALLAERATDTMVKSPADFRPVNVETDNVRFLGPVAVEARGLIQRVELGSLLTDELREALRAAVSEVTP